ncbi:MAG: mechanosensitive ion channel [Anaerolineae bacterium]|jgi:small-conductance mechanosensitive channel|nr:mechanosensitive ion channel [Anaerolineae bacterium]MBT4312217.1 mechanosensitive ion channel [Anaerolineae bacterium]MBT4457534.1 mechanosensitive ion channel [Anaerolineae bacterium]MBT4843601.1 mechanosensitive ion channel [Anaerolineae bacterium]MBT6059999.1 mechanosensitive ion channel [Anaerolineae bacterium]
MENIIVWLEETIGLNPEIQHNLFETLLTVVLLWLAQRLLVTILKNSVENFERRYQWQKGIGYLSFIIGLIAIGRIWLTGMETVVTFLGLLSAGIAIALKDPLINIAGWIYILARKPFDVGDRIEIKGVAGDVIDLRIFQFSIMEIGNWVNADQSTGRVLHIPNGIIFTSILSNYSHGFQYIWNELEVLITFESNWLKAKKTLSKIVSDFNQSDAGKITDAGMQVPENFMLKTGKTTPIVYTSVQESGVLLTVRYLCRPRRRRSSTSTIWENILIAFAATPDIELAYPTQRFYKQ